jgi:hypothetical protein
MKTFILPLMIIVLVQMDTFGQFAIRPFAGINSSTITKDINETEWKSELGYQAGFDMLMGNKLYFQTGLQWQMLNQKIDITNPALGDLAAFRSSHINIPVFLGMRMFDTKKSKYFNLRMFTGPDISFLLNSSEGTLKSIQFNRESLSKASYGYNLGFGLDVAFIFIDAGYRWGLSRFFDATLFDNGAKSNVFYANAGLKFAF